MDARFVDAALKRERARWVKVCRARAELWRRTAEKAGSVAPARDEARARANEAEYLADLIETGGESPDVA